jgi:hypothetical protein
MFAIGNPTALAALVRKDAKAAAKAESKSLSAQLSKQGFEQNASPELAFLCFIGHFFPC